MRHLKYFFTISFIIIVLNTQISSQTNLTKYAGNPVLDVGPKNWDSKSISNPAVIYDGLKYKMWYAGTDGSEWYWAIGYATSDDGISWTKHQDNPVLSPGSAGQWDSRYVVDHCVIYANGQYMIWYTGGDGSDRHKIGLATSTDGITWVKYNGNPLLEPEPGNPPPGWESRHVFRPSVIYDGSVFHMWYEGNELGGPSKIGYATSTDGKSWVKYSNNPILAGNTTIQNRNAHYPSVLWDGFQYVMYYATADKILNRAHIWLAFSGDGVNWQKITEPVLAPGVVGEWDYQTELYRPFAILQSGTYKVWYSVAGTFPGTGFSGRNAYAEGPVDQPPAPLETSEIQIEWHPATPHTAQHGAANVEAIGRKIYLPAGGRAVVGGYSYPILSIYDVDTDSWSTGANMPSPKAGNSGTTVLNGLFYHVGGEGPNAGRWSPEVEVYDPTTNQWTFKANWPSRRRDIGVATLDGKIYVVGGHSNYSNMSSDVDIYDPVTNSWNKGPSFPMKISNTTAISFENKLYVFGGRTGPNQANLILSDKNFVFDPTTNSWKELTRLPYPRTNISSGIYKGNIYLLAGVTWENNTWGYPGDDILEYSPDEDKFRQVNSNGFQMVVSNGLHAVVVDDEIFFVGVYSYDQSNNTFSYEPTLQRGKFINPTSSIGCGDYVFLADKSVTISRNLDSEGDMHSNGTIKFKKGNSSTHVGNISAVGKINIQTKNTIEGDVTTGDRINNSGNINGIITENAAVTVIPLPNLSFSAGGKNKTVSKNGKLTLAPGSYATVLVHRNGTLELNSGDYFLKNLNLDRSSALSIDVSQGPVTINVVRLISFGKNMMVDIINNGGEGTTDQVTFNNLNKGSIKIHSGAKVLGSIIAPNAKVSINKNVRFKGSICAKIINVDKKTTFLHHNSNSSLPKTIAIDYVDDDLKNTEQNSFPTDFELAQNYPNPFNPSTTIKFAVPKAGEITLAIYNVKGQLVRTLYSGAISAGRHQVVWNGTDSKDTIVANGIYMFKLQAKDFVATKKLIFTK